MSTPDEIVGWSLAIMCLCLALMLALVTSVILWKALEALW
jgi:hypothetical protein